MCEAPEPQVLRIIAPPIWGLLWDPITSQNSPPFKVFSLLQAGIKSPTILPYMNGQMWFIWEQSRPLGRRFRVTPKELPGSFWNNHSVKKVPRAVISGTSCSSRVTRCEASILKLTDANPWEPWEIQGMPWWFTKTPSLPGSSQDGN
jgi:hypothetical protein